MPTFRNSFNGAERVSADTLGYPWLELEDSGELAGEQTELAARTADAILLDVGTDADLAQLALEEEQERETPRTSLIAKLERIIRNAES